MNQKEYMYQKYGKENVNHWIENVKMSDLFNCLDATSNFAFLKDSKLEHRERDLNRLEMILQGEAGGLWASVTYGTQPSYTCYCHIGHLTNRRYNNYEIAMFLVEEKMNELKEWLLENHKFSDREIRLLHYDVKNDIDKKQKK